MKTIEFKMPRARKASDFVVYPWNEGDTRYKLQSGNHCIIVDVESNNMLVSKRFAQYPRFEYCNPALGGKGMALPVEIKSQLMVIVESKSELKSADGTITLVG